MSEEIVKVAVLEQKFADFASIVNKLDDAIQKMSEVNTNVIKMLAVHDERIEYGQRTDDLILKMIDDFKEENKKEHQQTNTENHNPLTLLISALYVYLHSLSPVRSFTSQSGFCGQCSSSQSLASSSFKLAAVAIRRCASAMSLATPFPSA